MQMTPSHRLPPPKLVPLLSYLTISQDPRARELFLPGMRLARGARQS